MSLRFGECSKMLRVWKLLGPGMTFPSCANEPWSKALTMVCLQGFLLGPGLKSQLLSSESLLIDLLYVRKLVCATGQFPGG